MATYRYATKQLSIASAKAFLRSITYTEGDPGASVYYVVLGNINPYPNDPTPVLPTDNEQYLKYGLHRDFVGGKKIGTGDASHVAPRYDWTSGTTYAMYRDQDIDMYDRKFYVVTDENNVYKCLYNNKGGASTIKPTGFSTDTFETSDGYVWKYMYTISLNEASKFMTASVIPVRTISGDGDGGVESDRLIDVQSAAVNGSIEIVEVNVPGSGYETATGLTVTSADATSITFGQNSQLDLTPDHYNTYSVYIESGPGAGQIRRINNWTSSRRATVHKAWATQPTDSSVASIAPTCTIVGDGKDALARTFVDSDGTIDEIRMIDTGSEYTRAQALITANTATGGATASVVISPTGGHGSDPINELFADKIALNVKFKGTEGAYDTGKGFVPADDFEFRTISVLKDPKLTVDENNVAVSPATTANTSNSPETLRFTTKLLVSYLSMDEDNNPVNLLEKRDIITQKRAYLDAWQGDLDFITEINETQRQNAALTNALLAANGSVVNTTRDLDSDASFYHLYINNVDTWGEEDYAFVQDDVIVKDIDGDAVYIATVESYNQPEVVPFTGEVVYTENVQPVDRDPTQTEDIKIILDF